MPLFPKNQFAKMFASNNTPAPQPEAQTFAPPTLTEPPPPGGSPPLDPRLGDTPEIKHFATEYSNALGLQPLDNITTGPSPPYGYASLTSTQIADKQASTLKFNSFSLKQSIGQGCLIFALVVNNANNLKFIISIGVSYPAYYFILPLIVASIILQVFTFVLVVYIARINIEKQENARRANIGNNAITILVGIITFVNIVISTLGFERPLS